jgi:hypothetical protein
MVQKPPVRIERRLSAILAADVAGYSRLMHHHEETTHTKLTALLKGGIETAIAEHGSRIVKNTGETDARLPGPRAMSSLRVQFSSRPKRAPWVHLQVLTLQSRCQEICEQTHLRQWHLPNDSRRGKIPRVHTRGATT